MAKLNISDHNEHVKTIFIQAIQAVDPYQLVRKALYSPGSKLPIHGLTVERKAHSALYLVALGKAAARMAQSVLDLSEFKPTAGVIAVPSSDRTTFAHPMMVFHAGHPHPTQSSIEAGHAAKSMLKRCAPDDIVLVLISGGGSALFELPAGEFDLEDLHALNELLLRSGLPIQQMNIIRSALSLTKAGGLARLAAPARVVSLILSDVVGDPLASIASGPTVLSPDRRGDARRLLKDRELWHEVPMGIRTTLNQVGSPRPKAHRPTNILLGGNNQMIDGAVVAAKTLGFQTQVMSRQMHGEASQVGRRFARRMIKRITDVEIPACFIMGGETTVTVSGSGKGGRNQEFALSAACELEGHERVVIASLASDGIDGPTDVAGAIIHGETIPGIQANGINPAHALAENNTYEALKTGKALYKTGPTGTNVADLALGLIYPRA